MSVHYIEDVLIWGVPYLGGYKHGRPHPLIWGHCTYSAYGVASVPGGDEGLWQAYLQKWSAYTENIWCFANLHVRSSHRTVRKMPLICCGDEWNVYEWASVVMQVSRLCECAGCVSICLKVIDIIQNQIISAKALNQFLCNLLYSRWYLATLP